MVYHEFDGVHDVTSYLETLDMPTLAEIRAILDSAARFARERGDGLGEGMSYGMPCLTWQGKALLSVVATRKHIGIYPYSGAVVSLVRETLTDDGIPSTAGAIQLPFGTGLAETTLHAIVDARIDAIEAARR